MFLQPGKTCAEAIEFLRNLQDGELNNIQNGIPHPNLAGTTTDYDKMVIASVRFYDGWVERTTRELRTVFADPTVPVRLRGERYGHIIGSDPLAPRTMQLLYAETAALRDYFNELANECRELQQKFRRHQTRTVVLDTNSLLHFVRFDTIPWAKLYGTGVCVVLPHVVVDEVDRKSFSESEKIQKRARGVYRLIEQKLDEIEANGFADLGNSATLEVLADELGHRRLPNNDDEVVAQAARLQQAISPTPLTVVTRDIGMRTRAKAWQLRAESLPDKFLIREDKLAAKDLDEAVQSLNPPATDDGA